MRKKNEIEQKLDEKELEADLHRDLSSQYSNIEVIQKLYEDKNPYVIGVMNFFFTLVFFELLYFLVKTLINSMTLGFTGEFFFTLNPFVHIIILILCITSVINRKSAVEVVIDRWPF
ncbi:hypothetical protein [Gracilimonas amylolytica]|uniref:hypothetical protein n=1 Tax=Gracilimonas amylolytica TaxID=1749045 RepID=UPI000CD86377|nr:hypothetical protein [Gracilimonas amylolytica]